MYGGSGKLGRGGGGGGGGAGKRNLHSSFHPPPLRPSGPTGATGGRLSVGGGPRNRNTSSGGPSTTITTSSAPSTAAEETFSLITGNPLNFAMIIRLTPDFVEEIKRVEAHGGTARIKFDSNANNTSGNVIDVGGKDFRFTWSREMGDLCDIYEERQSGEDGNGLLVESGCAWRKLNVQRVLDESTKNHVKMRSEEAERKLKSRKAIVLDHQNPSMKSQMKALAAVDVNPWKNFKQKKEPPLKKRKVEPTPVTFGGPPRHAYKPGLSSTTAKGRHSVSPLPSPPEPAGAPTSPFGTEIITKGPTSVEGVMPIQATNKENFIGFEKDVPGRATGGTGSGKSSVKRNLGAKPTDLRSMLISLLMEQPKGMTPKALEKAVGDTIPNSVKIEPIIKQIATFQAPGRYILKPGVDLENFKKPSSESGSSPEDNHFKTPVPEDNHGQTPIPELDLPEKTFPKELNSELRGESNVLEKIDIEHRSPDLFGDKKISDNSEGPAVSSSESGSDSDSDSDSSDSGSDSGSHSKGRSKSRSPVGSGTGSSSDSETDASSNSKQGSDEDVDIMTSDDEKESKHKLQVSEPGFSTSPIPYGGPAQNSIIKNQGIGSNVVDIEKDLPDDDEETEIDLLTNLMPNNQVENHVEETKPFSPEHQERQVYTANLLSERENLFGGRETVAKESFKHEKISKGKSKRASDVRHLDEKSERAKRSKAGNLARSQISLGRNYSESPHQLSPDGFIDDLQKGPSSQTKIKVVSEGIADPSLQKGYKPGIPRKSVLDSQESGRRSIDPSERSVKNAESLGRGVKYPEKNLHGDEGFSIQKDKIHRETQKIPNLHMADNNRAIDRPPVINGRGIVLQRELSDLELGELREPLPDEVPGTKKQFERKSSFKQSENKQSSSDYWNLDLGKGKPPGKAAADPRRLSSPHLRGGVPGNQDGSIKKRTPEHHGEDLARPHHRGQSQPQNPSRLDNSEVGPHSNKLADVSGKTRHNGLVPDSAKESKTQKSTLATLTDTRKDISLTESNDGVVKRRDFSSDENSCSYSKYEKEEPELKGPIKDFSQYKEYVQEYGEKYDSYSSLNKILETYRNEFQKLGRDLENAKGRDVERYHNILGQLNESYQQCGARHKQLKKIFVVLHEELKQLKQMIKDFADSCARD